MRLLLLLAMLCALPAPAKAEWLEASSDHFVIYADDSEKDITRFSQELERYHAAMEYVTRSSTPKPSPSNRVTIYVVSSVSKVQSLLGAGSQNVAGYYIPQAGGSLAIVPQITGGSRQLDFSMIILLHEYAHHYMMSSSAFGFPRWFSEGAAEFYASASFERDGSVMIGRPAMHRGAELVNGRDIHVRELFEYEKYADGRKRRFDTFYGKSWLLYHYLIFDETRAPQMTAYLDGLIKGASEADAAMAAFGDFNVLERELDSYARKRTMYRFKIAPEKLSPGPTAVRRLSAGEAAMMPIRIQSKRGVTREQALELLGDARKVAGRYRADAMVLAALAEAEHDAGNDAEAIAAADAALAIDPSRTNAYVQKGYSLFRMASEADDADRTAAYSAARAPFIALNKIENDHPLPLVYYYRSFADQGIEPSALAKDGLARAVVLAPFDLELRMNLASQQIKDKDFARARRTLAPVAVNPHATGASEIARKMIKRMDEDPDWNGVLGSDDSDDSEDAAVSDPGDAPEAGPETGGGDEAQSRIPAMISP